MNPSQPAKQRPNRISLLLTVIALVVLGLAGSWFVFKSQTLEEYASFTRPDGNYKVVVLRKSTWPSVMPGQAGDSPGKVQLFDRNQKLLHETDVEMVQLVENVDWGQKRVTIKLIAEWDLPD